MTTPLLVVISLDLENSSQTNKTKKRQPDYQLTTMRQTHGVLNITVFFHLRSDSNKTKHNTKHHEQQTDVNLITAP